MSKMVTLSFTSALEAPCSVPMLSLGIREESYMVSVPGEGLEKRQQTHKLSETTSLLPTETYKVQEVHRGPVGCSPGRLIRRASWEWSHKSKVFLQPGSHGHVAQVGQDWHLLQARK